MNILLPYLFKYISAFNQHDRDTTQYHSKAKNLSHCKRMPYRPEPWIWFSYEFNVKPHNSIADDIQAEMETVEHTFFSYTPENYKKKNPFKKSLVKLCWMA